MQLPERGRACRGAARPFPFGIPVWDAARKGHTLGGAKRTREKETEPSRKGQSPRSSQQGGLQPGASPGGMAQGAAGPPGWNIRPKRSFW